MVKSCSLGCRAGWTIAPLWSDEPDVLDLSKLAMRGFTVDNLPINILTAASKAEALEVIEREATWMSHIAVAFIDVIMENDYAGLELCQQIREEMKNRVTQLYIRTGQPGIAPERTVVEQYDISGYFTKMGMTEDKLYSLVKSGVRQFLTLQTGLGMCSFMDHIVKASTSRAAMEQFVQNTWKLLGQSNYSAAMMNQLPMASGSLLVKYSSTAWMISAKESC